MLHINHFTYGFLTPVLAYVIAVIGSLLGLQCAARARGEDSSVAWLCAAAVAIGGTGIWAMHFVAMLGFSIKDGAAVRFNVPLTAFSAAVAIVVVAIGLFVVGLRERPSVPSLVLGGTITGVGVAAMHYTGMAAMRTDAHIDYNPRIVALSVVIAVVASLAALWFTLRVRGLPATIGAALIMGVAVTGMHYTGMAAMSARPLDQPATPTGASALELLTPLIVIVCLAITVLLLGVATTETEEDIPEDLSGYAAGDDLADTRAHYYDHGYPDTEPTRFSRYPRHQR